MALLQQEGRFVHAVKSFQLDQFLAPYDLASHNRWRQLSCHITAGVLDALQPVRVLDCKSGMHWGIDRDPAAGVCTAARKACCRMSIRWRCACLHYNAWVAASAHQPSRCVCCAAPCRVQVGGNINVLAEADPALLRPATAAEEALYAQLQKGREAKEAAAAAAAAAGPEGTAAAVAAAAGEGSGAGVEAMQADQQPGDGSAPAAPADGAAQQQQEQKRWTAAPHAGRCFYTPLPRLVKRGGLTPQELTGAGWVAWLGGTSRAGLGVSGSRCIRRLPCWLSCRAPEQLEHCVAGCGSCPVQPHFEQLMVAGASAGTHCLLSSRAGCLPHSPDASLARLQP